MQKLSGIKEFNKKAKTEKTPRSRHVAHSDWPSEATGSTWCVPALTSHLAVLAISGEWRQCGGIFGNSPSRQYFLYTTQHKSRMPVSVNFPRIAHAVGRHAEFSDVRAGIHATSGFLGAVGCRVDDTHFP